VEFGTKLFVPGLGSFPDREWPAGFEIGSRPQRRSDRGHGVEISIGLIVGRLAEDTCGKQREAR
jgi:hypothetical protein